MKKEQVIVVLGPTSSGKTALSIELAKMLNGEIVSADSRQVYRGMDLGTGKVTKKEMQRVPHHLLDVANPKKQFSVAEYAKLAESAIADIVSRKKVPIICGGTAFYIDTLILGSALPEVQPNAALRKKLAGKKAPELFSMLQKIDSARARTIDKHNPARLVRAIEIATALGKVPKLKKQNPKYETLKIGLDMPDETLKNRIRERLSARIKSGMLKEAQRLHASGLSWRRMNAFGLEYRAMAELFTKNTPPQVFEENLASDIWQYVKRQRTWWKRDKDIIWLNPLQKTALKKAQSLAKKFLA